MDDNIFKKRAGTTDRGKDYEDLFVANLVLELVTDTNIKEFKLSSNDENFGAFDDVVVETESVDGRKQSYALQLKLSGRPLTEQNLTRKSGDFSIKKYFEDFTKLKSSKSDIDFDNFKWILFTNRRFDAKNGKKIRLEGEDFDIEFAKCHPEPLLTSSREGGCYYRLMSEASGEYQEFFDKFFLYTNQPNDDGMRKLAFNKLQENFYCERTNFTEYLNFITKWSIREGKKDKLNKTLMRQTIALCLLSPFIQPVSFNAPNGKINPKATVLRQAISKFNISVFKEENCKKIITMLGDVKNEFMQNDVGEINKIGAKFQVLPHHVKNVNELSDEECCKLMWLMDLCPLVAPENRCVLKATTLCENKSFILLSKKPRTEDMQSASMFESLPDLRKDPHLYEDVVKNFKCSLQGKEQINLETLIGGSQEIENLITTNELVSMLDDSFLIGEEKEELPVSYIERSLSKHIIKDKFLENIDKNTLIIVSGVDAKQNFFDNMNTIDLEKFLDRPNQKGEQTKNDIYTIRNEYSQEMFENVCEKIPGKKTYHQFRVADGKLEWVRSRGGINDLREFKIDDYFISEDKLFNNENDNNVNIICENPGMGKSTLMKSLKNNNSPSLWTILIYPKDHSIHFREKGDDVDQFLEHILKNKKKEYETFDSNLFEALFKKGRINYIWDGLDEISERNSDTVMNIVAKLSKRNVKQWMTSRNNLKATLEKKFNVLSRTIKQFNAAEQERYIQQRLKCSDSELHEIFNRIKNSIKLFKNNKILGIPLQIYMFTELFRQNSEKYNAVVNNLFTITDLYYHFVQEKFNIYNKKRNIDDANDLMYEENEKYKNDRIASYEKVAMKAYFQNNLPCDVDCEEFLREIREGKDPVGIITAVSEENVTNFLHNSYGEYFAASHISKHPETMSKFSEIIFDEKFKNIRFMFDSILARGCPAHITVLYKNLKDVKSYNKDQLISKDKGGRNVLHLACSYGGSCSGVETEKEGLFNKKYTVDIDEREIRNNYSENQNILEHLTAVCNPEDKDVIFNLNSFEYADRAFCLFPLALMLNMRQIDHKIIKNFDLPQILCCSVIFDFHNVLDTFKQIPFVCTTNDSSLLHLSVKYGSLMCLNKLAASYNYKHIFQNIEESQKLVVLACRIGYFEITKVLIEHGADIHSRDDSRNSLLHLALRCSNIKIVKLLISRGINVNSSNLYGETPLYLACECGNTEIVKLLIENGANVHYTIDKIPLGVACKSRHSEIVTLLVQHGTNVDLLNNDNETQLHLASQKGNNEIVKLLIELGANVNPVNKDKSTPLHLASKHNNYEIMKLLIEHGANVHLIDNFNSTPLDLACEHGNSEIVRFLIDHGACVNSVKRNAKAPLHFACRNGHSEIVKLLVENGANVNAEATYCSTPLHFAWEHKRNELVKFLIEHGADTNYVNKYDKTPFSHLAWQSENYGIVKLSIEHGADVNSVNELGETLLYLACKCENIEIVKFLIRHGADLNANKPLHLTCENRNCEIAKLLIESGADVDSTNGDLNTPLHLACRHQMTEIVNLLIVHGADVNLVNSCNDTSLHLVCRNENTDIVKRLIEHGANINAMGEGKDTPLHIALRKKNPEIVKFLLEHEPHVNSVNKDYETPLYLACLCENHEIFMLLIERGGNVKLMDKYNKPPLHSLCQSGDDEKVKILIENGANIHSLIYGITPLHLACESGSYEIVKLLTEHGADVNFKDATVSTPLYLACQRVDKKIVKFLIEHGANVNSTSGFGFDNVLHLAHIYDDTEIVKLLIGLGANVNAKNADGNTSLHFACERRNGEAVEFLIQHGADVNAVNVIGSTPLHHAYCCKNINVVEVLIDNGARVDVENMRGGTLQEMNSMIRVEWSKKMDFLDFDFFETKNSLLKYSF